MAEIGTTCKVVMYRGNICGRHLYMNTGKCICHCESKDIDNKLFLKEIEKTFEDNNAPYYDFSHFIFPSSGGVFTNRIFKKQTFFYKARFTGPALFSSAQFSDEVVFDNVAFFSETSFIKAQFAQRALFERAKFKGEVHFSDAQFQSFAFFANSTFSNSAFFERTRFSGEVKFIESRFLGKSIFNSAKFESKANFFGAVFQGTCEFYGTTFSGEAHFNQSTFSDKLVFMSAHFFQSVEFTKAMFSDEVDFYNAKFSAKADFEEAQFLGNAVFMKVKFNGESNFCDAKFLREADFMNSRFAGDTDFSAAEFSGETDFYSTQFTHQVSFLQGYAKGQARVNFDHGELQDFQKFWCNQADFRSFRIEDNAIVTFRKIGMTKVYLLESDIGKMRFIDVDWPRSSRWHRRRTVADELIEGEKDYALIAHVYQGLQENYSNSYRYLEAGDFFVGEQEVRRRGRGKWGQHLSINNIYRILSFYGQSMLRPLYWFLGVVFLTPWILMLGGVSLSLNNKSVVVNYDLALDLSEAVQFLSNYRDMFFLNFSFMAFSRNKMHDALTEPWQLALVNLEALVVIALVTMSLLAVRRRFKRKNF